MRVSSDTVEMMEMSWSSISLARTMSARTWFLMVGIGLDEDGAKEFVVYVKSASDPAKKTIPDTWNDFPVRIVDIEKSVSRFERRLIEDFKPGDDLTHNSAPTPIVSTGSDLIAAERNRQKEGLGYDEGNDDMYGEDQLALAAVCYALPDDTRAFVRHEDGSFVPGIWPWDAKHWKPNMENRIDDLVRAGALIAAEIDRLNRIESKTREIVNIWEAVSPLTADEKKVIDDAVVKCISKATSKEAIFSMSDEGKEIAELWLLSSDSEIVRDLYCLSHSFEEHGGIHLSNIECDLTLWKSIISNKQVIQFSEDGVIDGFSGNDSGMTTVLNAACWITWHVKTLGDTTKKR